MRITPVTDYTASRSVDSIKSIMAYSRYLIMRAQLSGNLILDGHDASAEEEDVAAQCRALCDRIARRLQTGKESEIPELMECYDIIYRIGNKRVPDKDFIDRHKRRAFKAWKSGTISIDESKIIAMIAPYVSYCPQNADREYLETSGEIKERWFAILMKYNHFPNTTAYEDYQRIALMMREDLTRYFDGDADKVKIGWYEANRVGDLSTLSSTILCSYRRFVGSLFPAVMDFEEKMELDNRILTELIGRTDLHPHDRQAFRLALQYNRDIIDN